MFVRIKLGSDPSVKPYQPTEDLGARLVRTARRFSLERAVHRYDKSSPAGRTFFSQDRTMFHRDPLRQMPHADLIQLHWVADFIDYEAFFSWLPKQMPLVLTLHDMANFTGGCCYDMGCGKFAQQCGACPQLGSIDESDLTRQIWQRKQQYYNALDPERVRIVTPSRWLGAEVGRGPLLSRFPRSVIPYGLDLDVFQPRDRRVARELLGIPNETRVLLFIAAGIHEPRKGFAFLSRALDGIESRSKLLLLCVGPGVAPAFPSFACTHIDGISNDRFLSFIYSAADVFVAPALADNLPNTLLESIACGTPVVAFAAGGVEDAVRPGVTGLLAKPGDAVELRDAILNLLSDDAKRAEMSRNCRRIAVTEYDLGVQAGRYLKLYEDLLRSKANSRVSQPALEERSGKRQ
jgi:glycosyltransferase involved in cell wall biosynthesis